MYSVFHAKLMRDVIDLILNTVQTCYTDLRIHAQFIRVLLRGFCLQDFNNEISLQALSSMINGLLKFTKQYLYDCARFKDGV